MIQRVFDQIPSGDPLNHRAHPDIKLNINFDGRPTHKSLDGLTPYIYIIYTYRFRLPVAGYKKSLSSPEPVHLAAPDGPADRREV